MIRARDIVRLGVLVSVSTLLACVNESTAPVTTPPATSERVFTSLNIQVPPLAAITGLNESSLDVLPEDQYGAPMIVGQGSFSISSETPSVARVSDARFASQSNNLGKPIGTWLYASLTAVAPGKAVISVSWTTGGVTKTAKTTLTVESTEGWSAKPDPATLSVKFGSTVVARAMMVDATGKTRLRSSGVFSFTSDRSDVVAIHQGNDCHIWGCDGMTVRGVALGEATVTARLEGFSTTIRVTVVQ
jgi:hypothetical protein